MNTISNIHDKAMAKIEQANKLLGKGQSAAYKTTLNEALALEKEAAYALLHDFDCEPTRSVLFRSAAAIAINAKYYSDAISLATEGLNGNPFTEIRKELSDLLQWAKKQLADQEPAILNDDGDIIYKKTIPIVVSTSASVKQSVYDTAEDVTDYELIKPQPTIFRFFPKDIYSNTLRKWMQSVFAGKEQTKRQIKYFLTEQLTLFSNNIHKEDTRWIWYPREYWQMVYSIIMETDGNGIRIYFGQFEENHPQYAAQTCLIWVPTKHNVHDSKYEDIIIEDELSATENPFFNHYYIKKEIANQRIINYRQNKLSLLAYSTDRQNTQSIWYSKQYVENMIEAINYTNASGVRIYFGHYAVEDWEDSLKTGVPKNQICLVFTLTQQNENMQNHQDMILEESENFSDTLEMVQNEAYETTDLFFIDSVRYEPPYIPIGSKFPYTQTG
jgi:hypothetical protein